MLILHAIKSRNKHECIKKTASFLPKMKCWTMKFLRNALKTRLDYIYSRNKTKFLHKIIKITKYATAKETYTLLVDANINPLYNILYPNLVHRVLPISV